MHFMHFIGNSTVQIHPVFNQLICKKKLVILLNIIKGGIKFMLKNKKISLIGTGNMGEALLSGLISSGSSDPKNIICTDIRENRLKSIQEKYGVHTTADNIKAVEASELLSMRSNPRSLRQY
jgi:threonine dehydrogenase-like Zn-dependent dehydrogenase